MADDPWAAFGSDEEDDEECDNRQEDDGANTATMDDSMQPEAWRNLSQRVTLFLMQEFLKKNSNLGLDQRRVCIMTGSIDCDFQNVLLDALRERNMQVTLSNCGGSDELPVPSMDDHATSSVPAQGDRKDATWYDAVIVVLLPLHSKGSSSKDAEHEQATCDMFDDYIEQHLVPGGVHLLLGDASLTPSVAHRIGRDGIESDGIWNDLLKFELKDQHVAATATSATMQVYVKRHGRIQTKSCPWLSWSYVSANRVLSPALLNEYELLKQATVPLAAHERASGRLTEHSIQSAMTALQTCGYCILPGLLESRRRECLQWGQAVLDDLHEAAEILVTRDQVDLYHPATNGNSHVAINNYRELSMREDFRMDMRDGPRLQQLRKQHINADAGSRLVRFGQNAQTSNATFHDNKGEFFRGHPDLLHIVGRTMNPQDESLYQGNFGRHNFSGSGPDGSFQDLRVGPIGGIVSLPGAADQALHADTPHLFEHLQCLPAHYINAFTPGCKDNEAVGQTAFVHGSHQLDETAKYFGNNDSNIAATKDADVAHDDLWKQKLVRPCLMVGDIVLFDCRILHFGLANTSKNIERPLLYTNMVMHWFHDPKNWDNERPIFGESK
ncbi:hypothetical protein MPSEU_000004900 [Mayamaea pseudoterrestris]|nr:hypothetical protein MPSEU_000004900 [Mayamaea pseudoterrestris]